MASHFRLYSPPDRTLLLTQVSILLLVLLTGIVSSLLVRSQMHRYDQQFESIPIANTKTWDALRH